MDDDRIIEMLFMRDEAGISAIDAKYGNACRKIAENILGNAQDAEECVNDAYLGVWNAIPPERPSPFLAFLYKILRNLSIKKLEFNRAEKRSAVYEELVSEVEQFLPAAESVENRIEQRELAAAIDEFLSTLTPENRKVFTRRYWFSESYEEIAREMGMSEGNVSMRLVRIRKNMKKFLERKGMNI